MGFMARPMACFMARRKDTTLQLCGNVFGDQLGILIGALYLNYAQGQYGQLLGLALVYQGLALSAQLFNLRAAPYR